jgi:hypothetical protein
MIEKYIRHWANLIAESCNEQNGEVVSEERIGISRDNDLTMAINGIISPDLFKRRDDETKDLYMADFKVNTTDTGTLFHIYGKQLEGVPQEKTFMYFMCQEGKLTLKRMCDYINEMCSGILPQKLKPSQFIKVGPVQRRGERTKMDLYLHVVGTYSKVERQLRENFLVMNGRFRQSGLMYKHGDYEYFSKIFAKAPSLLRELDKGNKYLVLFYLKGTLSDASKARIFNKMNDSQTNAGLFDKPVTTDDILELGEIRARHKSSQMIVAIDVCAVKTAK